MKDWPPPYRSAERGEPAAERRDEYPPPGWPTHRQVEYTKEIILLGLLVLALPWLISTLASQPQVIFTGRRALASRGLGV